MSTHTSINSCNHHFNKGDNIEVLRNAGDTPAWFPATIIDSPSPSGTLHVNVTDGVTRPEPHRRFTIGENVEVFYENGWRRGEVKDVSENCMYTVVIGGALEVLAGNLNVRVCDLKQVDGSRVCSSVTDHHQEKSSHELILQSKKGTKLRIICSTRDSKPAAFEKGSRVEARSYDEGYHGARYVGRIVGSAGEHKFLVQYDTLTTDDQMKPLVEMVHVSNIRPLPPVICRQHRFNMLEEVDAWYHDGWWVGVVTKVLANLKYVVYFWTTNEELEFQHSCLRSHQELINDKWVASFSGPKLAENHRLEKIKLQTGKKTSMVNLFCGLKVEIAYGAGRFLSTWYPAVILGPTLNGKYLVEYRTLKTQNKPELVEEEVDVLCIRPSPPIIQQARQFNLNDAVDAWDVNGWRIGQIRTIVKDFKYEVYFWATDSVVELEHAYLRPHQDFIDGAWIGTYEK